MFQAIGRTLSSLTTPPQIIKENTGYMSVTDELRENMMTTEVMSPQNQHMLFEVVKSRLLAYNKLLISELAIGACVRKISQVVLTNSDVFIHTPSLTAAVVGEYVALINRQIISKSFNELVTTAASYRERQKYVDVGMVTSNKFNRSTYNPDAITLFPTTNPYQMRHMRTMSSPLNESHTRHVFSIAS